MNDSEPPLTAPTPLKPREGAPQLNDIIMKARSSWLKNTEVVDVLTNIKTYKLSLCSEPPNQPPGGTLFLFDRKQCRFFRKDGHNWRKKPDGKTVRETHEKLKVGNSEVLNCYYAHADQDDGVQGSGGLQRRCYWLLDEAQEHIVLVHYLNCATSRVVASLPTRPPSSGDLTQRSAGRSSGGGPRPRPPTAAVPGPVGLPMRPGAMPPPGYMLAALPINMLMQQQQQAVHAAAAAAAAAHAAAAQRAAVSRVTSGGEGGVADGSMSMGRGDTNSIGSVPTMEGPLAGGGPPRPPQYGLPPSLQQQQQQYQQAAHMQRRLPPHALGGPGYFPYPPPGGPPPPPHHPAASLHPQQQAGWHQAWLAQQAQHARSGYEGSGPSGPPPYMGGPYGPGYPPQQQPYPGPPPPHAAGGLHPALPPYGRAFSMGAEGESMRPMQQGAQGGRLTNLEDSISAFLRHVEQSLELQQAQQGGNGGGGGGGGGGALQGSATRRHNSIAKLFKEWEESSGIPLSQLTGLSQVPPGTASMLEATISALQEGSFPSWSPDWSRPEGGGGGGREAAGGGGRPTDLREIFRLGGAGRRPENGNGPPMLLPRQQRREQLAGERQEGSGEAGSGGAGMEEEGGEGSGGVSGATGGSLGMRPGGGGEEPPLAWAGAGGSAGVSLGAAAAARRGEGLESEAGTPNLHRRSFAKAEASEEAAPQRISSAGAKAPAWAESHAESAAAPMHSSGGGGRPTLPTLPKLDSAWEPSLGGDARPLPTLALFEESAAEQPLHGAGSRQAPPMLPKFDSAWEQSDAGAARQPQQLLDRFESRVDSSMQQRMGGGGARPAAAADVVSPRRRKQLRPESSFHSDAISEGLAAEALLAAARGEVGGGKGGGSGNGRGHQRQQGRGRWPGGQVGEELGGLAPFEEASFGERWGSDSISADLGGSARDSKRPRLQQLLDAEASMPEMINRPSNAHNIEESMMPIPRRAPSPPPQRPPQQAKRQQGPQWQPRETQTQQRQQQQLAQQAQQAQQERHVTSPAPLRPSAERNAEGGAAVAAATWRPRPAAAVGTAAIGAAPWDPPPPPGFGGGGLDDRQPGPGPQALALIQQLEALKHQVIQHLLASGKVPGEEALQRMEDNRQQQLQQQQAVVDPHSAQQASHGEGRLGMEQAEGKDQHQQGAATPARGEKQQGSGENSGEGRGRGSRSEQTVGSKRPRAEEEEGGSVEGAEQQPPAAKARTVAPGPPASAVKEEVSAVRDEGKSGKGEEEDNIGEQLGAVHFGIIDFTPDKDYVSGGAKMIITGTLTGAPPRALCVRFGDVEVPADQVHPGVLRCTVPPAGRAGPGPVRLCVALPDGGPPASKEVEFEYLPERQAAAPVAPPDAAELAKELVGDKELQLKLIQVLLGHHSGSKERGGGGGGGQEGGGGGLEATAAAAGGLPQRPGSAGAEGSAGAMNQPGGRRAAAGQAGHAAAETEEAEATAA